MIFVIMAVVMVIVVVVIKVFHVISSEIDTFNFQFD